jgi:hypothetical protein
VFAMTRSAASRVWRSRMVLRCPRRGSSGIYERHCTDFMKRGCLWHITAETSSQLMMKSWLVISKSIRLICSRSFQLLVFVFPTLHRCSQQLANDRQDIPPYSPVNYINWPIDHWCVSSTFCSGGAAMS